MKRMCTLTAVALGLILVGSASASIVFSDDFTGSNGSPLDSTKWTFERSNGTGTIENNAAQLYGNSDWAKTWVTSTTGADFLAAGQTVTYSATLASIGGPYTEGSFGVADAATMSYKFNGDWNRNDVTLTLNIAGTSVGTFTINANTSHDFSIVLTPTTYAVTMAGVNSGASSYTGNYSLSSYASGGRFIFRTQHNAGNWVDSALRFDNVAIDVVPEPATLIVLASGTAGLIRRRVR